MPNFSDLPLNLTSEILHLLAIRELAVLSRTCRSLHAIVEPLLYKIIDWTWTEELLPEDEPPICLLFRTLCERPELSSHVKKVYLHCKSEPFDTIEDLGHRVSIAPDDRIRAFKVINEAELQDQGLWRQAVEVVA